MSHQIRPGVRGGRDQFSWDQVKEDKQRSNYLGSSIHGVPDKFKKGPETFWYAKGKAQSASESKTSEIEAIKIKEKQMMEALLGGAVEKRSLNPKLSGTDLKEKDDLINVNPKEYRNEYHKDNRVDSREYHRVYRKEYQKNDHREYRKKEFTSVSRSQKSYDNFSRDSGNYRSSRNIERSPHRRTRSRSRSPKLYK